MFRRSWWDGSIFATWSRIRPTSVPRLWKRSFKIYGYHLLMLALAFTVVASFAVHTHQAALTNLLDFYLAHPVVAITGSVLLLYCPPLLDILPMYVTFLFFTPVILSAAVRWGWRWILAASAMVWLLAQFGLRDIVHNSVVHLTHLHIPLQESRGFQSLRLAGGLGRGAVAGRQVGYPDEIFRKEPE